MKDTVFRNVLIGINIVLIVLTVSLYVRLNTSENEYIKAGNTHDEVSSGTRYDEQFVKLEKRLNDLEVIGDIGLKQRVLVAEIAIGRLEDLIIRQENVDIKYGVVKGIEINGTVSLKVREKKLLRGEEAVVALMEERDIERVEAQTRVEKYGCFLSDQGLNTIILEIPNDCRVYMISEAGLVEAQVTDLIDKAKGEIEGNFEDDYTFVLMDNRVVQIYQAYIPGR